MQAGLPEGVRVVPFYDRTRLIQSAIHTVTGTLKEEMIIASIAILLILTHLRSALVVCVTLPMAVLVSFLFMYYLDIPSNIMSLCGIAISIGILVDAAPRPPPHPHLAVRDPHQHRPPLRRGRRQGRERQPPAQGAFRQLASPRRHHRDRLPLLPPRRPADLLQRPGHAPLLPPRVR